MRKAIKPQKKQKICKHAADLLEQHKVTTPPVPIDRIAKMLGIQLRFSPLDKELSGMIYIRDGVPIVGVNSLHHPNRQRYTLAHECGHFLLHKAEIAKEVHVDKEFPMLMRDSVSAMGINEIEMEANLFAAELLMPVSLINQELENNVIDIDDEAAIDALARRFKVSQSAMRFRLGNLLTWN